MTHVLFGQTWTCPVPLDNRWIELNSPVEFLGINYECSQVLAGAEQHTEHRDVIVEKKQHRREAQTPASSRKQALRP